MNIKKALMIAGLALSSGAALAVTFNQAQLESKGAIESKAATSSTTFYVDVSDSYWKSAATSYSIDHVYVHFYCKTPSNDSMHDEWNVTKTIATVGSVECVSFSLDGYSDIDGFDIYYAEHKGGGNQTGWMHFYDFSEGQNVIKIGSSNGWTTNQPATFDKIYEGSMTVDITGCDWSTASEGQNIALYLWNGSKNDWGSYVFASQYERLVTVDYRLLFSPTNMKVGRWAGGNSESNWKSSANRWTTYCWGQTNDLTVSDDIRNIIIAGENGNGSFVGVPYIHGGKDSADWGTLDNLINVKLNYNNEVIYYQDVTFDAGSTYTFGIKISNWGNWWAWNAATIADSASTTGNWYESSGNIRWIGGAESKTIRIAFNRTTDKVYINDPEYALADEWGYQFINSFICEDNAIKTDTWSEMNVAYTAIDDAGTYAILAEAPYLSPEEEAVDYYALALQRYDLVLKKYGTAGHTDFIGRSELIPSTASMLGGLARIESSNTGIVITITSIAFLVTTAGFFLLKKRKEN